MTSPCVNPAIVPVGRLAASARVSVLLEKAPDAVWLKTRIATLSRPARLSVSPNVSSSTPVPVTDGAVEPNGPMASVPATARVPFTTTLPSMEPARSAVTPLSIVSAPCVALPAVPNSMESVASTPMAEASNSPDKPPAPRSVANCAEPPSIASSDAPLLEKSIPPAAVRVLPPPISIRPPTAAVPASTRSAPPSRASVPVCANAPLTPASLPPTARLPHIPTPPLVVRLAAKPNAGNIGISPRATRYRHCVAIARCHRCRGTGRRVLPFRCGCEASAGRGTEQIGIVIDCGETDVGARGTVGAGGKVAGRQHAFPKESPIVAACVPSVTISVRSHRRRA